MSKRVCIIGSGISGLCIAHGLKKAGVDSVVFERGGAAGGNIKSELRDGFLIEYGPNSMLASPEMLGLIEELKITDQIAVPRPDAKRRYIVRRGRLLELPSKILGLVSSQAFSMRAKLRLLKEPLIDSSSPKDESIAAFFERRLGKEIVDYAVDPFISGIYAGDPKKLSMRHAFPKIFELEKRSGSLIKGALFSKKDKAAQMPKGTPRSITFLNGMQTMTDALAGEIGANLRLNTTVASIEKADASSGYTAVTGQGSEKFDAVVICTPSHAAAGLVASFDPQLAAELQDIYYPPIAVVFTAFKKEQVAADARGFGFLVPGIERRKILGSLWTSSVFENRAPEGYHLFTTFIGGARKPELAVETEDELIAVVREELDSILRTSGEPVFTAVKKWDKAIPQYNIGYQSVHDAIDEFRSAEPGIFFCSNFYKGISVGDCIKNAISTAGEIKAFLDN